MNEFREFLSSSDEEITAAIRGKTVIKFEDESIRGGDFLVLYFDDGSVLRIRYDWIYEWQFSQVEPNE